MYFLALLFNAKNATTTPIAAITRTMTSYNTFIEILDMIPPSKGANIPLPWVEDSERLLFTSLTLVVTLPDVRGEVVLCWDGAVVIDEVVNP